MTVGKASALAAGFVGAFALGVAIGPAVHDKVAKTSARETVVTESTRQQACRCHCPSTSQGTTRERV